jgi:hypothetical protein
MYSFNVKREISGVIKITSSLLIWPTHKLRLRFISNYGCTKPKIETKKVCHL